MLGFLVGLGIGLAIAGGLAVWALVSFARGFRW